VFLLTYFITSIINELFGKCETIYKNFIIMYFILYYRKYNPNTLDNLTHQVCKIRLYALMQKCNCRNIFYKTKAKIISFLHKNINFKNMADK